jgi:hypothetical protein
LGVFWAFGAAGLVGGGGVAWHSRGPLGGEDGRPGAMRILQYENVRMCEYENPCGT